MWYRTALLPAWGSSAASMRARRSFALRQPELIRSTRRARSSMRAFLSASRSVSIRSMRLIIWFMSRRSSEIAEEIGDRLVVVTDTRVVPARIPIEKPKGEVLLLERIDDALWEGLARPTRRLKAGATYGPVELIEHLGAGRWRLRLAG